VSGATGSRKRSFPDLNGKLVPALIFQSSAASALLLLLLLLLSSVTMSK